MTLPIWSELTTEERRAIIRPLWIDGKSASEIAIYFHGATRNAIIGQVSRDKMQREKQAPRTKRVGKVAVAANRLQQQSAPKVIRNRNTMVAAPKPSDDRAPVIIDRLRPPIEGAIPISLLDFPNRPGVMCRFPVEGGYCGAASGDAMYCDHHRQFVYTRIREDE